MKYAQVTLVKETLRGNLDCRILSNKTVLNMKAEPGFWRFIYNALAFALAAGVLVPVGRLLLYEVCSLGDELSSASVVFLTAASRSV